MQNPIKHGVTSLADRITRSFTADEETERTWTLSVAKDKAKELGVQVIDVLHYRKTDSKSVLLCESPEHGRCILKVLPRHLARGSFRSYVATARIARDFNSGIFPAIYHIGSHYVLLEWVEGESLKFLPEEEWKKVDFVGFFRRVHDFSRTVPPAEADLAPESIRLHAESYLRRSFRFVKYQHPRDQLASTYRLYADRKAILRSIQHFDAAVSNVTLPGYTVPGDLTSVNVVLHPPSRRLLMVDVEDVTNGVLGFDCAWLLATVARRHCPLPQLIDAYRYVSSEEFGAHPNEVELTRLLLKILLENDLRIVGSHLAKTRRLLELVTQDIEQRHRMHAFT